MAASKRTKPNKKRQLELQQAERDSLRRRYGAAFVVLMIVGGLFWQADRWLDVHLKKIQIEGELTTSERAAVRNTIAKAIKTTGGTGLHSLSLDEVRSAVSALSWADRVSARRRWPDTLVIRLVRHSVVARWGGGGFVASNGQVIIPARADTDDARGLPLLDCKETNSAHAMEVFNLINRTLSGSGLKLVELRESELGGWTVGVAGDRQQLTQVTLGRDELAPRLQRFLAVRSHLGKDKQVASVDARYHNGVAVRWLEEGAR